MALIKELYNVLDQGDREVGIEIEMEGNNLFQGSSHHWKSTEDGSLRGESVEWVLRRPVKRKDVPMVLGKLMEKIEEVHGNKLIPSDRCGVHVHINCQNMTVTQVFNFVVLYLIFEDVLVRYCGNDREGNLFCLRARDAEALLTGLAMCAKHGDFGRMQDAYYRYAAINMSSLSKYGSIEFRTLPTTVDFKSRVATWTSMLLAVKDRSLEFEEPTRIIEAVSKMGSGLFFESTFKELSPILDYPGINKDIHKGMRRAQDIAFANKLKSSQSEAEDTWRRFGLNIPQPPQQAVQNIRARVNRVVVDEATTFIRGDIFTGGIGGTGGTTTVHDEVHAFQRDMWERAYRDLVNRTTTTEPRR